MPSFASDGATWRIGTVAEAARIGDGTSLDLTITAGIPRVLDAYATVVLHLTPRGGLVLEEDRRPLCSDPTPLLSVAAPPLHRRRRRET